MIYGLAASVLPVWLLLAPRDYLSTFMKLGHGGGAGGVHCGGGAAAADAGGDEQFMRRRRLGGSGAGVSVRLHHHRVWSDLRIPLADLLGHDTETARARVSRSAWSATARWSLRCWWR